MGTYSEEENERFRIGLGTDIQEARVFLAKRKLQENSAPTAGSSGDKPLAVQRYHTLIASYIFGTLEPEWSEQFEKKNASYGEYDAELGPLAEAVEIHRKHKMLKRAFIEKVDTSEWAESPREIAMDMIGHLYLLIAVIDEEADNGK